MNQSTGASVRPCTQGIYVSRNTYVKPGITDWANVKPVHLVAYYRYFRFFSNGEFITKTSPHKLAAVAKTFKSRYLAAKDDSMYHGGFRIACEGDEAFEAHESRLHLESVPKTHSGYEYTVVHYWLRQGSLPVPPRASPRHSPRFLGLIASYDVASVI